MSCARKSSDTSFDAASGGLSLLRNISKEAADYLGVFDAASGGLCLVPGSQQTQTAGGGVEYP